MDQLEDDTLICVLRLLAACDIGALARTQHAMADAVRRISQNSPDDIFPNGAGSEQVIGQLAGDDHMNLRKLQAAIERVGRMPPTPLVEITDLTLLVQFLNVTYGAEERDEDGRSLERAVIGTSTIYSKWVALDATNFPHDAFGMHVDLSNDAIPLPDIWTTGAPAFHYGVPYGPGFNKFPSPPRPAGDTEFVLKLMMHRRDTGCAAVLYESGHGRLVQLDGDWLTFEGGPMKNGVGTMWHQQGPERQANVYVHPYLPWGTADADTYPFEALEVNFEYIWPNHHGLGGDAGYDHDDVGGLGDDTLSFPTLFTHRLRWVPV